MSGRGDPEPLDSGLPPPPMNNSLYRPQDEEDDRFLSASRHLLEGEADGAQGGDHAQVEEKQMYHKARMKKLIADLRRDCSVDEVSPEEIEMLDVGFDDALPESEVTSVHSMTVASDGMAGGATPRVEEDEATDTTDASVKRLSRKWSMVEMEDVTPEITSNNRDEEPARDEASVEAGGRRCPRRGLADICTWSPTRKMIVIIVVLVCLALLLPVILVPKSLVYVEYHEYALAVNSVTGSVDYSTVYDGGCYLLRPQDHLIRFNASAHFMEHTLEIMTDTGLSIKINFSLQYFLKREELGVLYQRYHNNYDAILRNLVEGAVKNLAVGFTLDQYRLHRKDVEMVILKRIQSVLTGNCCEACCPDKCGTRNVACGPPKCNPRGTCSKGHHVTLHHFQMGAIDIPDELMDRFLRKIILELEAEREEYFQAKAVEVKKTEQIVQDINNKAVELIQHAHADSRRILAEAEAAKEMIVEKARQEALRKVFDKLNISDEEVKLSYIYAHSLAEKMGEGIHPAYGYDSLSTMAP